MKIVYLPDIACIDGQYAATIGFFDGLHRGHRYLLNHLKRESSKRGLASMAITFACHPKQVVQPSWHPQLLSTLEEKEALMEESGIDVLVVLRFDSQMAALSAREFMSDVLSSRLGVKLLLTGYDNRFGRNRQEDINDYVDYGRELGVDVVCSDAFSVGNVHVSSSHVRELLLEGDVKQANDCLGYIYGVAGKVVQGCQIGRRMGFPTANLLPNDSDKLIPGMGVYAVLASIDDGNSMGGMTNIGMRPTFSGSQLSIETHLFGPCGNLYGRAMRIRFVDRLRSERLFDSPGSLMQQLEKDRQQAERILTIDHTIESV